MTEFDTSNFESNSILSELDKGLRSAHIGDECYSIVRFPDFFANHQFPILINSACLKLAESFRNCSNFSRLLILRVLQSAEKHLEKILNLDEFIRRITTVCYSNDPVARAITLRVLGSIACVASTRKNIHHAIRNSLDSIDEIEVQAAIEAAALFSKQSSNFALSIYPKILSILSNTPNLSVDTKIKLLSVLHHEHYNSEISKDVRKRCLDYLRNNESKEYNFISAVLNTLTYISITSLTDIDDQIDVLLNIFKNNSNLKLKCEIINELQLITRASPHFWSKQNIADFINILKTTAISSSLICGLLTILELLIKCPCLLADHQDYLHVFYEETKHFCLNLLNSNQLEINRTANCLRVMTELSNKCDLKNKEIIGYLIKFLNSIITKEEPKSLKLILKSVVTIANQNAEASNQLIELLCSILINKSTSNRMISLVCETICAINDKNRNLNNYNNLIKCIKQLIISTRTLDDRSLISLCTLYFQLICLELNTTSRANYLKQLNLIKSIDQDRPAWFYYRLVRQTMRYGHHELSLELTDKLQYFATNENVYFWFMGLLKISEAECNLIRMTKETREDKLLNSIELLSEALSFLKGSILDNYPQNFACEFIKLRSRYLHNYLILIKNCKMIRSSPAASISNLIALNSRDEILKCGPIVNQMRENCREFRKLADDYSELYRNSFNADQNTLIYLQLLQNCCTIMAEAIESIFHANRVLGNTNQQQQMDGDFSSDPILPEHYLLKRTRNEVKQFINTSIRTKFNNTQQTDQIESKLPIQTENLLEISEQLLKVPTIIPRYFFQPLQNTVLKLQISPQPKANALDQSFVIYSNTNFAFKVEGLIRNDVKNGKIQNRLIREVKQILIEVTSITKSNLNLFDRRSDNQKLQSIVEPHNDYFQEQFLLSLKTGYHQINVDAFVIDQNNAQWNLNTTSSILNVKVLEEII